VSDPRKAWIGGTLVEVTEDSTWIYWVAFDYNVSDVRSGTGNAKLSAKRPLTNLDEVQAAQGYLNGSTFGGAATSVRINTWTLLAVPAESLPSHAVPVPEGDQ
jgi:hypothetical protein